ncbi:MAG TPA: HAD-IIIA family hydrolase [Candidatus Limnocylindrales bacterium]|nr:HAD-IIIA family hydrolase [Candidatus Limnocylindrales bacterium]
MAGECPVAGVCVAFLDRDGTINVKKPEGQYVLAPQEVNLVPGAGRAVRELNDAGWRVIVVTNQRALARELMSNGDLARVHARLDQLLAGFGARVDEYRVCPHREGTCWCRKPHPGLLKEYMSAHADVDVRKSWMVGDSESDVEAGMRASVRTLRLAGGATATRAERVEPDLSHAVKFMLGVSGS